MPIHLQVNLLYKLLIAHSYVEHHLSDTGTHETAILDVVLDTPSLLGEVVVVPIPVTDAITLTLS